MYVYLVTCFTRCLSRPAAAPAALASTPVVNNDNKSNNTCHNNHHHHHHHPHIEMCYIVSRITVYVATSIRRV